MRVFVAILIAIALFSFVVSANEMSKKQKFQKMMEQSPKLKKTMECAEAKGMGNLGDLMKSFDEPSETAKKAEEMVHPMHHPRPMKHMMDQEEDESDDKVKREVNLRRRHHHNRMHQMKESMLSRQ